jgi:hypothetical protein
MMSRIAVALIVLFNASAIFTCQVQVRVLSIRIVEGALSLPRDAAVRYAVQAVHAARDLKEKLGIDLEPHDLLVDVIVKYRNATRDQEENGFNITCLPVSHIE